MTEDHPMYDRPANEHAHRPTGEVPTATSTPPERPGDTNLLSASETQRLASIKTTYRPSRRAWIIIAVFSLLLVSYAADSVASIGSVRSGVRVDSLELEGKSEDEARELLTERMQLIASEPVELFADTHRVAVEPEQVGFTPDVDSTLEAAMGVGREGNFFVRTWHRIRTLFASTDVGWRSDMDTEAAAVLTADWASRLDTAGHEAGIEARGTEIFPVGAVPDRELDQRAAIVVIKEGLETWPRQSMELPIAFQPPKTDLADAERAAEIANRWVASPVALRVPDGSAITLTSIELAGMIVAVPVERDGEWELDVQFSNRRISNELGERMTPFEHEAVSASFAVQGTSVTVREGQDGRVFDPEGTAEEMASAARREERRTGEAKFLPRAPALTTEDAQALKITELVSTFTTEHPCCQPRVSNIHKMADAVDGTIVAPGQTFSLNEHVGQRTQEKGYVLAPMIFDGEYRDDVGGGVSQFATTFFNAAFFGGYEFNTYKAHSYYISRYPAGREATISYPNPDLRITNDSGAGILVKTHYSNTSITVSFYGDKEGKEVRAESEERTNFTEPEQQRVLNPDLPPGSERVVQRGAQGFDIVVYRIIKQHGDEHRERFFTRYRAQPHIIEVGPKEEEPEEGEGEEPSPEPRGEREEREPPEEPATPEPAPSPSPSP